MKMIVNILIGVLTFLALGLIIAVPATLSLPGGIRPGLEKLTIKEAAQHLRSKDSHGWEMVKDATVLIHNRMMYCRRNSFDHYKKAFERGYGYCQQNGMH
ncbi:MAG: hypothetical protein C0490_15190 [Marivirga sp.]|nr:hypothetical protein [Marivirga sp.]